MKQNKTAFSGIELAVVLIIIGLLFAGIVTTKGNLFSKAKLNKIISATKNSPLKDMNELAIWFDVATDESFKNSEMVEDGGISIWKNIAPQNYHNINVEQSNASDQPLFSFDDSDNLPMLSFDGVDDVLITSDVIYGYQFAKNNQVTVFIVQKYYDGDNIAIRWGVNSNRFLNHSFYETNNLIYWDFGNTASGGRISIAPPSGFSKKWQIITLIRNTNDTGSIRVGGVNLLTSAMADEFDVTASDNLEITNSATGSSKSDLREMIIFKRALTDNEINEVEKYLSKKWDINLD